MKRWIASIALMGPAVANAATMKFITYNSFDETVMAFQRLALLASDTTFVMFAGLFMAVSVMIGAAIFAAKGHAGQASNPMALFVPLMAGLAFFVGTVLSKGTIYVHDDTVNKEQAVGDVPDLIVFVAGALNSVEHEVIRMVDTASSTPYSAAVGSLSFGAVYAASISTQPDVLLEQSIGRFVTDCGLTAMGVGQNGTTMNKLMRDSDDLLQTLSDYAHPSWPTTWWPKNVPGGATGTCDEAWAYLQGELVDAGDTSASGLMRKSTCEKLGMSISDARQAAACDTVLDEAATLYGSTGMSSLTLMRQFVIARGIMNMMQQADFNAAQSSLTNQRMMAEGFGAQEALSEWVPKIRGFMLALVLGITPIALLFLMTSMVFRVLGFIVGMYAFLVIWGICDAVSVQMAKDAAIHAFNVIAQERVSFEAMMTSPSAAVQALALFGKYRTAGMGMAAVLSGVLFRFSSQAFDSMSSGMMQDVAGKGSQSGVDTMTPAGSGSMLSSMAHSTDTSNAMAHGGVGNTMSANAMQAASAAVAQSAYLESVSHGLGRVGEGYDTNLETAGAAAGGKMAGENQALAARAASDGVSQVDAARNAAYASTLMTGQRSEGDLDAARRLAQRDGTDEAAVARRVEAADRARTGAGALETQAATRHYFGGPDGDLDASTIQALSGAADTNQTAEQAAKMKGGSPQEQMENLSKIRSASQQAMTEATGGDADKAIAAYEVGHKKLLAQSAVERGHERAIGTGQGWESRVSAGATMRGVGELGAPAMVQGRFADTAMQSAKGDAMNRAGGIPATAHEQMDAQIAKELAAARISRSLAKFSGRDANDIKERIGMETYRQGHVSWALADGDKSMFTARAMEAGQMTADQAERINSTPGPVNLDVAYDANSGEVGAIHVAADSTVATGQSSRNDNTIQDQAGLRVERGNVLTTGDDVKLRQPEQLADDGSAAQMTYDVMGGDLYGRTLSDANAMIFARGYTDMALHGEGRGLAAQAARSDINTFGGGLSVDARYGTPGKSASPISAGLGGELGFQKNRQWSDGHSMSADAFQSGMLEKMQGHWAEAQQQAFSKYGDPNTWDAQQRESKSADANMYLAGEFAKLNHQTYNDLIETAKKKTGEEEGVLHEPPPPKEDGGSKSFLQRLADGFSDSGNVY